MGNMVWPVAVNREANVRVWIGRLMHWALTVAAAGIVASGIWVSASVLSEVETTHAVWPETAVLFALACGVLGFVCFWAGRSLRYIVARE